MEISDSQISDCEGGKLLPIPIDLHSVYEDGPFRTCTVCSTALISETGLPSGPLSERSTGPLSERSTGLQPLPADAIHRSPPSEGSCLYEIQKVYQGDRVIFEMALCQHCGEQICQEFSEESMEALKGFLLSHFRPSSEACHCHFCGFPRALLKRMTLEEKAGMLRSFE